MLLLLRKPSAETVRQFILKQQDAPFSYPEVGATQGPPPPGYTIDHNRTPLGTGEESYQRAVEALRGWKHFDLGWAQYCSARDSGTTWSCCRHGGEVVRLLVVERMPGSLCP